MKFAIKHLLHSLQTHLIIGLSIAIFAQVIGQHSLLAQAPAVEKAYLPEDATLKRFAQTISSKELRTHLTTLASDAFQGRETGTAGQRIAAAYITEQFKQMDLQAKGNDANNDYEQSFGLITESWDNPQLSVNGKDFTFLEDYYAFGRISKNMTFNADEAIFVGYGINDPQYNDYAGIDATNKVLLMFDNEPKLKNGTYLLSGTEEPTEWSTNWRRKVSAAKAQGAKAVFIIKNDLKQQLVFLSNYINSSAMVLAADEQDNNSLYANTAYISKEVADVMLGGKCWRKTARLQKKLSRRNKPFSREFNTDINIDMAKKQEKATSSNVLAFLPGSHPSLKNEVLVITAHYDHLGIDGEEIYNGADDDGSGTVALLEIADAFSQMAKEGLQPKRSILFMAVSGEEKGLLGSKYYTDYQPLIPLEQTIANLNIDMVGRIDKEHTDGNYVYIIGSDKLSSELHRISEAANLSYTKLDLDYTFNDENDPNQFYYRSDHYNFAKNNIPIIFYFNGTHDDYHKPTDTADKINYEALTKRAQLVFYTAYELCNRTNRIAVDVPQNDRLPTNR